VEGRRVEVDVGMRGAYDLGESGKQTTAPDSWLGEEEEDN
jgi:hypothetical protein